MMDAPLRAVSLDDLRAKLTNKTYIFQQSEGLPNRWKSLASGTTKIIRRDGDRIYVETVLPEADKQAGCFVISDLKKQGETYSGTSRERGVCRNALGVITNRYSLEYQLEITNLSPTRIEGWVMAPPKDAKFNCGKGSYSKPPVRQLFTWIPEGSTVARCAPVWQSPLSCVRHFRDGSSRVSGLACGSIAAAVPSSLPCRRLDANWSRARRPVR